MTWNGTTTDQTVSYSLAQFDAPDGSLRARQSVDLPDEVVELLLVDPRAYTNNPAADVAVPVPPPNVSGPPLVEWLDEILTGEAINFSSTTNVFVQRVNRLTTTATPSERTATGGVPLWQLPPGDFRPVLVARSRLGAVSVFEPHKAPNPAPLQGINIPPWLAFATDIMGTTAGVAATQDTIKDWVPDGRFLPLPRFTASIAADTNGFLSYDYGLDVEWATGNRNPGTGLLAFAPGELGLAFSASSAFGLRGANSEIYFTNWASVRQDQLLSRLLPPVPGVGKVSGSIFAAATSGTSSQFDPVNDPYQFEFNEAVSGGFDLSAEAGLNASLGKLRYIGPVVRKLKPVDITGLLDAGVELVSRTTWRTPFPAARPPSSVGEFDQVFRRHFFGGEEEMIDEYDICLRFGAGVRLEDSLGVMGATGKILLVGAPCNSGAPSMSLTVNPANDWPAIKRIQGEAKATLEVTLDVWLTEVSRMWEWSLLKVDKQFGTEPTFQLTPLIVETASITPATAGWSSGSS
ncbi:MAG TPA: hypothetical protein DCY13_16755, partial [Verrucomicrobiales bacterium]|nr:hypothetical protein [Verrucomicrobiales bacterium]